MSDKMGYIAIFRDIMDHWVWKQKPFSKGQAWIDLILLATHKTEKKPYKDKIIEYERGKIYKSELEFSTRWGWNRKTVHLFLKQLESDGMIEVRWTTQGTTITIVNYDFYQTPKKRDGQRTGQRDGQRDGQRRDSVMDNALDIYKNVNNVNHDNHVEEYKAPPEDDMDDEEDPYADIDESEWMEPDTLPRTYGRYGGINV